jgi:AcrR family transcriptional regulator
VLDASLDLFVDQGPSAVTVAAIAERAGMTPAAVYYHFPSKVEVLVELVDTIGDSLVERFDVAGGDELEPWLAATYDALDAWRRDSPAELALYLRASVGVSPAVEALRRRQHHELVRIAGTVVARSRPDLDAVEVPIVALGLVTLLLEAFAADTPAPRASVVAIGSQLRATAPRARLGWLRR